MLWLPLLIHGSASLADDPPSDTAADNVIVVQNPHTLPERISAERIPVGLPHDYKPCLALLPGGELLLVMFRGEDAGGGKVREDIILYRSTDGGRTWGKRRILPLVGREPYFSLLKDGTLFITTHLLAQDVRNKLGYIHSYLHRTTDGGQTWTSLQISAEDVPGAAPKSWTHTSRNVLELADGTLILGVSAGSSLDYFWRSRDRGQTWDKSLACRVEGFDVTKQGFPWHAETVFQQSPNGDILGIARCHSSVLPTLDNTKVPTGNDNVERMALFRSRDGGRLWTLEAEMGNDYAEMYPAVLPLVDGRLLLTFTVRALQPPLGVHAVLGRERPDGIQFDFEHDRMVIDQKTPVNKPSGGGFGNTVQLDDGRLVSCYTYRAEQGHTMAEVVRWRLPARTVAAQGTEAGASVPTTAGAEETAGVLPSWWITEVPSVVIPGGQNATEPVVMQADSGTLVVAAAGSRMEGQRVRLSGSVAAVTWAESPGPFDGDTYLDIHRADSARPKAEIVFDSDVTGSDTLEFSFAINIPTNRAADAGTSIILKDSDGTALNTIVAYDEAGGAAAHYWRLNEGNHAGQAEFPPALTRKPAGVWEQVTITRAADASVFKITVDGVSATYSGTNLRGNGRLHSISFETNGAGGFYLDGLGEPSMSLLLTRSRDGGETWDDPREIARSTEGGRISAGAAGTLPTGRLVVAAHQRSETPGQVTHAGEQPAGVHHYSWSGFHRQSELKILVSDDDGQNWTEATASVAGGPLAVSASGKVFTANGASWLPVYGPSTADEMDSALSSVGLMRSDDNGGSWRFSHWVVTADQQQGIGYGPGEITVLPDGRWLGLLQGNYRNLGDYTKPRLCRTISMDGGRSWSVPEQKLLGPGSSTVLLDSEQINADHIMDDRIMVGGWKDRGIMFSVGANAGAGWLYQDQVWSCIWYQGGSRGGTRLLKVGDAVLVVYHWMDKADPSRTEVKAQVVRPSSVKQGISFKHRDRSKTKIPQWKWELAEAYQVPDIAAAPAGIRSMTLLKLLSGDWICLGFVGSKRETGAAYGFAATGLGVLKASRIEGPWKKVADVPVPSEVGESFDPGSGASMPRFMVQHSSGRLLVPFSTKSRDDIILIYSDDEGTTWDTVGSMNQITGRSEVNEADVISELPNGDLVFPMLSGFLKAGNPLIYVRSSDGGLTWSEPAFWASHAGARYEGLPHGIADMRETGIAVLGNRRWLGIFREERGTLAPPDTSYGPLGMPWLCLARSSDDGHQWIPSFGFLGVEPAIAALPGGAVMVTYREDNHASVWLSYDQGDSWQVQHDPAEFPWRTGAAEAHGQWPPGGSSIIRVLDENTVAVICDTGLIPVGKLLPPGYKVSKELHGRVQVRFFRRRPTANGHE